MSEPQRRVEGALTMAGARGVLVVALALFCGCTDSVPDPYTREILPSGTPHAINVGSGTWSESTRWVARIGLTLGQQDGTGPDVFGSISAVAADSLGKLFVLDGQAQDVRVFDADGTHLTTIGRHGEGPGEFRAAAGLNLSPEGHLWVWDPSNQRFSVFSTDGTLLRTVPRRVAGVVYPWRGEFDSAGNMIDWGLDFPQSQSSMDMGRLTVFHPIQVNPEDGRVDSLPALRFEAASDHEFRVPFRQGLTFHLTRSGHVWLALTTEYVLHRRTLAGDTVLVVSRIGVEPVPVTPVERDSIIALPDPLGEMTGDRLRAEWIPEAKPLLVRMTSDDADHLLVFPRVPGSEPGSIVDVFVEATGEYLGQVQLPVRLELNPTPVAVRGALVGVTKGEFDVPIVVRIHLGPTSTGG